MTLPGTHASYKTQMQIQRDADHPHNINQAALRAWTWSIE